MFEYIKGILQYKGADFCVIDVGGVGFRIYTSYLTAANIGQSGQTVTLYTYMNVKEDEISLFGFASKEELSVFTLLIGVSGVGPKGRRRRAGLHVSLGIQSGSGNGRLQSHQPK